MITGLYAGILAILMVGLGINTTRERFRARVSLGDKGNEKLLKAIRAHGNLVEYLPWILLMMLMVELQGASANALHGVGILLVAARVAHGYAILFTHLRLRQFGGTVTWLMALGLAGWCILNFLG